MELLKVVVLVIAFVQVSMVLSIEGEQYMSFQEVATQISELIQKQHVVYNSF